MARDMTFAGRILREYDATGRQSPDHPIACLVFDFTGQPDHYLSVGELCQLTSVMPAGTRQKLKPVAAITGERCSSGNLGKICLGSIARARSSMWLSPEESAKSAGISWRSRMAQSLQ